MTTTCKTLEDVFLSATTAYGPKLWSSTVEGDLSYTYSQFAAKCKQISAQLLEIGVGAGERVAIFSTGTPNWSVAFFASTAYGRVAVPILPDFSGPEAESVLEHSGSRILFAAPRQLAKLSEETLSKLDAVYDIISMKIIRRREESVETAQQALQAQTASPQPDDLAVLIYTSGTTGTAKGVMLSHRNFIANIDAGLNFYPLNEKDVMLSILPLAHAYELSLGLIYPFSCGSSVFYISKPPTPSYLMAIMQKIRPTAMLTVPLIIEKVYKGTILPMIKKSRLLTWMDAHMNLILCRIIGRRMVKTFGGRMRFFGIGGAKLDVDVERFLHRARFPYYIGYGLTECAPLLALCTYRNTIPGQIGRSVYGVQLKLDHVNRDTGEGEIVAKGPNIMLGYYKDPERTAEAFNEDGWFRTRDVASIDAQGRYAIKGRIGNMIVGANGENIYPEEIEKVVKEMPLVDDVLVVRRGRRLVGLVKVADAALDIAHAESPDVHAAILRFKASCKDYVNARVSANSQLSDVEVMKEPFEKTATLKIRRFKYTDNAPTL